MKIMVATVAIAALVAAALIAVWTLKFRGKGKAASDRRGDDAAVPVVGSESPELTTQDLIRVAGFDGACAVNLDGTRVVFVHVDGKNMSFATAFERDADAEAVGIALAGMRHPYTIHRCQRPIDTTIPVQSLRAQVLAIEEEVAAIRSGESPYTGFAAEKRAASLMARRELIEGIYLPQALGDGATKYETDVYITMGFDPAPDVAIRAEEEANAFISLLAAAGYQARVMKPNEVVERITNYYGRFPVKSENHDPYYDHADVAA